MTPKTASPNGSTARKPDLRKCASRAATWFCRWSHPSENAEVMNADSDGGRCGMWLDGFGHRAGGGTGRAWGDRPRGEFPAGREGPPIHREEYGATGHEGHP